MAERSFAEEVRKLRLKEGEVFRGEGILAVTKALLESGVAYVAGYQGAPISHLMDVLADAEDILAEHGIRFEASASEAAAAATLAASVNYPLRGAATFKSTVGTNVASDALANLASGGVTGGALVIVGEDYGEGSSIMQERSHAFAMKSQMWLLDPRPNLPAIVKAVKQGFELSEATNTPVMLELRIRACHVHGEFVASDNHRSPFTLDDALRQPRRDTGRIVLPPASFAHEQEKLKRRWPAALDFIQRHGLNEFVSDGVDDIGLVVQGGNANTLLRVMERLGVADVYGRTRVPLYVLNVTYPIVDAEVLRFCQGKRAVLLVEEGQPDFIEQNVATILRRAGCDTVLHGKDLLPPAGEYTAAAVLQGVRAFLERYGRLPATAWQPFASPLAPANGSSAASAANGTNGANGAHGASGANGAGSLPPGNGAGTLSPLAPTLGRKVVPLQPIGALVQARPPGFCTGCPERPIFTAMKLVERELGPHHVSADIGCHLFSILPPFNLGNTTMGYGLGTAGASAFNPPARRDGTAAKDEAEPRKRAISVMGDGGFWHNGLVSGIAHAVFNRSDNLTIVVDNRYTSATGGQDIPSSTATNPTRSTGHAIENAVRGVGVNWVRTVDRTYDLKAMRGALKEALTTRTQGPKVLIAQSECMLNRQRREKPLQRKAIAAGERVVRERFGVDEDTCTGDHSCIRLSGCPSLTVKPSKDPLRTDPVAAVLDSCVGCGLCGEVSHAAVLCPSFYRAEIVDNPTAVDRRRQSWRQALIGRWQRRDAERRARWAVPPWPQPAPQAPTSAGATSADLTNDAVSPSPSPDAPAQPIKIAVLAMGGEGGGVLADWIVDLAEHEGWIAQTTSVPGVAQRTGATIYYVELYPGNRAKADGERPVLALMPLPGDVDIVLASELMEAGRAVQRGLVTPDRTTLIASTHRVYAIAEKTAMGDGRMPDADLLAHADLAARRFVRFDMAAAADAHGSVISAVLFGALAGTGVLPFARDRFTATIERGGVGVKASLAAFDAAAARAAGGSAGPAVAAVPSAAAQAPQTHAVPPRAADPAVQALLDRVTEAFPPDARRLLVEGVRRTVDYQDIAHAAAYLDRVARFSRFHDAELLREAARHVALWMTAEDTIRVADLKTRDTRFARVRAEVRASDAQVVAIHEYLHPRLQEIAESLPAGLGRRLLAPGWPRRLVERLSSQGRVVTTTSLRGFALLRTVAALRRWRRSTLRFQADDARIEAWLLQAVEAAEAGDVRLATELLRCQRLVKGYGDTHERGLRSFETIMQATRAARLGATAVRQLRDAALTDEHGVALAQALARVAPAAGGPVAAAALREAAPVH